MLKKVFICSVVSMFVLCGVVVSSMATDSDSDSEVIIINSEGKKPAEFPHKQHQKAFECKECHHGITDGKKVAYTENMKLEGITCGSCHNSDNEALAGKKIGKLKLDTIKGAGHANCLACHKKMAKENADLKAKKIDKCAACHPKKNKKKK